MPKVIETKKIARGKDVTCEKCHTKIEVGEMYYKWEFRYGGAHSQHVKCGRPRPSQLTQSKMSGAYAALESAEDQLNAAGLDEPGDIASILNSCAEEIGNVADEYQEGIDNMPEGLQQGATAQESEEKINNLNDFKDNLESVASDIEGETFEFDEDEPEEPAEEETEIEIEKLTFAHAKWQTAHDEAKQEWIDGLIAQASDALGEASF